MGVSNVYNQAKASAVAALKASGSVRAARTANFKPEHLRMTGSIFNAPTANSSQPTLAKLNITATLSDLNKNSAPAAPAAQAASGDITEAKKLLASTTDMSTRTKEGTAQVRRAAGTADKLGTNANRYQGLIADANKKFTGENTALQARIKLDNQKIEQITRRNQETQKAVDDAQRELETLVARRSFSMGQRNGNSGSNNDDARINELQTFIGSKVSIMQANGRTIYSLQRSQTRTLAKMQRTNRQYVRTNQINTKNFQCQQKEDSKIIKVATEVEKYSALTQTGGQVLSLVGKGLMALGKAIGSTGYGAAIGAAMISTGQVLDKIGVVAEMVGQYGQATAGITKSVAYAAEGNIQGAIQSAAMAVQSGCAAAKSTANLGTQFKAINQSATEATNAIAAKSIARDIVKENSGNLGGMTEKEARKAIAANLKEQFDKGDIKGVTSNWSQNNRLNQLKEAAKADNGKITTDVLTEAKKDYNSALNKALPKGYTATNGVIKKGDNDVDLNDKANESIKDIKNKVGKKASSSFGEVSKSGKKSSSNWIDNLERFSQGFNSLGQLYMMYNSNSSMMGMNGMNGMNGMMNGTNGTNSYRNAHSTRRQYRNSRVH